MNACDCDCFIVRNGCTNARRLHAQALLMLMLSQKLTMSPDLSASAKLYNFTSFPIGARKVPWGTVRELARVMQQVSLKIEELR